MDLVELIERRLITLNPSLVELHDDSHEHSGHPGAAQGGSHFSLTIVSAEFAGLGRIARHQMVYKLLQDLIPSKIHALAMRAFAPEEYNARFLTRKSSS